VPAIVEGLLGVLLVAIVATVLGVGLGIVIAPRIRTALDRADADDVDEEPGDRPD
jgi:hypothetical protein